MKTRIVKALAGFLNLFVILCTALFLSKVIQSLAGLFFILLYVVPGFDHRLHWSYVPTTLVVMADVAVVCGMLVVLMKRNSCARVSPATNTIAPQFATG